jgi:glycosyltransferase involved in cell wall biosynthesis
VKVAYVYPNPRAELARAVAAGAAPDTGLLGQNHLNEYGIAATIHESRLRRTARLPGLAHRLTWFARELTLPWEVGDAAAIVSPLGSLLPLAAKVRKRSSVVLLNVNFCTALDRLSGLRKNLLQRSLRSADAIVCLASAQRTKLLGQADLDPARVHVVHLGVDERFYRPRPEAGEVHVLAVGRDDGRDYATFTQAIKHLDVRTTIVASARNLSGIDLPAGVEVELDVNSARLRDLYASATCVVIPTRSLEFDRGADCSGQTVLLDAMAMGRPAVVTERTTLADYVEDGTTALFVPPEEPEALAGAVASLLANRDLRDRLSVEGRAAVEKRFTTRAFAAGLVPILKATE